MVFDVLLPCAQTVDALIVPSTPDSTSKSTSSAASASRSSLLSSSMVSSSSSRSRPNKKREKQEDQPVQNRKTNDPDVQCYLHSMSTTADDDGMVSEDKTDRRDVPIA